MRQEHSTADQMMVEPRGAHAEIACTRIDVGCDVKRGYCMKMDARGAGSLGDMQKRKRGAQHMRAVCIMTLDYAAVCGSVEIADGWTLTTAMMQKCLHEHSSV